MAERLAGFADETAAMRDALEADRTVLAERGARLESEQTALDADRDRCAKAAGEDATVVEHHRTLLASADDAELVRIAVVDQGIGIAKEAQGRVFERFYRVDKARSRATGGTGLGLSIVKHVAADHGGTVELWSTPGRGSTFTLVLPRLIPEEPDRPDEPENPETAAAVASGAAGAAFAAIAAISEGDATWEGTQQ